MNFTNISVDEPKPSRRSDFLAKKAKLQHFEEEVEGEMAETAGGLGEEGRRRGKMMRRIRKIAMSAWAKAWFEGEARCNSEQHSPLFEAGFEVN